MLEKASSPAVPTSLAFTDDSIAPNTTGNICPKVLSFKCIGGVSSHCFHSPPNSTESLPEPKVTVFPRIKPLLCLIHGVHRGPFEQPFIALSNTFRGCTSPINQGELLQGWQQTNNGGTPWHHGWEKKELHGIGRAQSLVRPGKKAAHRTQARCPSKVRMPQIREMKLGSLKSWMSYLNPLKPFSKVDNP